MTGTPSEWIGQNSPRMLLCHEKWSSQVQELKEAGIHLPTPSVRRVGLRREATSSETINNAWLLLAHLRASLRGVRPFLDCSEGKQRESKGKPNGNQTETKWKAKDNLIALKELQTENKHKIENSALFGGTKKKPKEPVVLVCAEPPTPPPPGFELERHPPL